MLIETVYSMLTLISHMKKMMHRVIDYLEARLAFTGLNEISRGCHKM